jgi:hypothetical protein
MTNSICHDCVHNLKVIGVKLNAGSVTNKEVTLTECMLQPNLYHKLSSLVKFNSDGYPELKVCNKYLNQIPDIDFVKAYNEN